MDVDEVRQKIRQIRTMFRWAGLDAPKRWQGEDRPIRITLVVYLDDPDTAADLCDEIDSLCSSVGIHLSEQATWERLKDPLDEEQAPKESDKDFEAHLDDFERRSGILEELGLCIVCRGSGSVETKRLDGVTTLESCSFCDGTGQSSDI